MALIENPFPPLPILKFSFLGCWFLQTRTDPLPPLGTCLAHLLKGGNAYVVDFTAGEWEEGRHIVLIVVPILKDIFLLNFTLMSHLDITNSPFLLLAKAFPPFPKPHLVSHTLLTSRVDLHLHLDTF